MNKYHLLCLLSFLSSLFFSQSKIMVSDADTQKPVQKARISCNKLLIGNSDQSGNLMFTTSCKKVEVSAPGYISEYVLVDEVMEVALNKSNPTVKNIEPVFLSDKSDPRALEILKKVNEYYPENSPSSLDSYSYMSYEKISLDLDQDSIVNYQEYVAKKMDSLKSLPQKNFGKKEKKDSIESLNLERLAGQSKMFLWERASQINYSKKYGEKINVLDNKVSGLREPIYELIAFRSNRNQIPKEIKEENRNLYRFFLTDSIEIDSRENYIIRFRQVGNNNSRPQNKYSGYLYVDKQTYGLKKIQSNSKMQNEGAITSVWVPVNKKWFLLKEDYKLKVNNTLLNLNLGSEKNNENKEKERNDSKKFGTYAYATADYFNIHTPVEFKAEDFKGYTLSVKNSDGSLMDQYRTSDLSTREELAYNKIDSLSNKYKLDQKVKGLIGLLKGNLRLGVFDFDLSKVVGYNKYEHFRLGAGVKLNDRFNKYISPDVYFAYGIYDKRVKFGAGVDVRTTLQKNSFFRLEYENDVMVAGRFSENLWNFRMKLMNSGIAINNNVFYQFESFKVSYENDLTNGLTLNVAAQKSNEESKFTYSYKNLGNSFDFTSAFITLKYSPNSKNMMTPNGKYTFEQSFPEFYFNYEQGLKIMNGNMTFSRFDALIAHNFKTKIGVTGIRAYGGIIFGDAPVWKNFTMNGLANGKAGFNFNLTSYLGFATMDGGRYFSDKFVGTYITHRIPWYFKSFGKNVSSFDFIYRGIIGNMKNAADHQFQFEKLNHLYNEVGLEWNNFLSSQFNLGFFYRLGYYNTPSFKNNFAIQFKLKLLGF